MNRLLLWLWFACVVRPVVRLVIGISVHGREHLSIKTPSIIVANHNSHLDTAVLMSLLRLRELPQLRPVAAADYFERNWLLRLVSLRCMNALLIERHQITRRTNPLETMASVLEGGQSLLLFPEGTRGEPEVMSKFQAGVWHLVARRPITPVIPVFIRNLGFSLPRGELVLVPLFCDVYVGRPLFLDGKRETAMHQLEESFSQLKREANERRQSATPAGDR